MADLPRPALKGEGDSKLRDLEERLVRFRERVEREGRTVAVEKIDRAIEEARRQKK